MKVDARFLTESGPEIMTGNELLLKGALEAEGGTHLLGGYPGSPVAGFFDSLALVKDLLNEKGIRAVLNNNEALAAAMLNGSQMVGCRAMIAMKSVGVHVAADALALGNLAGAHAEGGAIVVYGDDPWSDSTQVAADSRYISKHLYIPTIEPSTPQEVKDYVDLAYKLSRGSELYAGYVLTTNLADGGGTAVCRPNQYPAFNTRQQLTLKTAEVDLDKRVLLPPRTWTQEATLAGRFARAIKLARSLGLNRILHGGGEQKPLGFITSGMAHTYLTHVLLELGLLGELPILKFGLSYPLDPALLRELASQCGQIVVVEERRGFMEEQLADILLKDRQLGLPSGQTQLWGKTFPGGLAGLPDTRGLHPSILAERLVPLLKHLGLPARPGWGDKARVWDAHLQRIEEAAQVDVGRLPLRTATFCPGCPHRGSSSLCLQIKQRFMDPEYMGRAHQCGPVDLLFHGDTGCYTMLMFQPNAPLMHNYSGMGLGAGTGSGIDPFITNKQVVFMGDSTFFHSGQIAISQALKLDQDITFIILDNRTTAMTGHQPTPGVDYDILGNPTVVQDIESVVRGIADGNDIPIVRADPARHEQYGQLLERTFLAAGVKVIIADRECGITRLRRQRRQDRAIIRQHGFLPQWQHMNINQEICRFCLACTEITGCPGLKHVETDYGRKMDTDITSCVDDGACASIGACPAFERVTIKRKRPPKSRVPELGLDEIPEPQKRPHQDVWRCALVGVGGMGIGLVTSVLVRAGHKEGYHLLFMDKKGLAIRNGGTLSQIIYLREDQPISPIIPYGQADLLIGVDVLEAARTLDGRGRVRLASPERTAAVINTDKALTISALMGQEDFSVPRLESLILSRTRGEDYLARNISRICEKYLGSKLYANVMMLGFAFQKGLIPVSMHSMAWAIKDTIRTDHRKNLYAFNMGRKLVVQPDLFQGPPRKTAWQDVLEEKCRFVQRRYRRGGEPAEQLRQLAAATLTALADLDEPLKRDVVVRLYDCLRWGGMAYARRYADGVLTVFKQEKLTGLEFRYAATQAVIHNLASAMLITDEVFLSELATSPEKRARDREKYNVNPANGDRIVYRHLLHPRVRIAGRELEFHVASPSWPLSLLKRMTFLRRLPGWRRQEQEFLRQYEAAIAAFAPATAEQYRQGLARLASPRCYDCLNPRCQQAGCPLVSDVPQLVHLAYEGKWREASILLHQDNNFPEFTGRICPAFCQDNCKQGIDGYPVQARRIELEIIEKAYQSGWIVPQPAERKSGRRVAVIGSGPAGLAAAQQLARAGHAVTVFEKDALPGGLLRYGVPEFRLPKAVLDRRLKQLTAEGVEFRANVKLGFDVNAAQLRGEFDAVILTSGAARPRELDVPGRDKPGVYLAMEYLRAANLAEGGASPPAISAAGKTVVVIGGGLTGEDCVETALRQGARQVHQLEIMPQDAVPHQPWMDEPEDSRVQRQWCVQTKAFDGSGQLQVVRVAQVRWSSGPNGRAMRPIESAETLLPAEMAVLALGYDPAVEGALAQQLGVAIDARGRLVLNDGATSAAGVFAAGDLSTGPASVATAIGSGRRVAEKVNEYLNGPRGQGA